MDKLTVAFICVENAGRSQIAQAFAEKEVKERNLGEYVEVISAGTDPGEEVHREVIDSMKNVGLDLTGNKPSKIEHKDMIELDYVVNMGCSGNICPGTWTGVNKDWEFEDPANKEPAKVDELRDRIKEKVHGLMEEIEKKVKEKKKNWKKREKGK